MFLDRFMIFVGKVTLNVHILRKPTNWKMLIIDLYIRINICKLTN